MKRIGAAVLVVAFGAGCKEKPQAALPPLPEQTALAESDAWKLTLPKLDAYLQYQRTLLVQAGKLPAPAWDGGALKAWEEPSIAVKADLDERARTMAGLSSEEVEKIEAMIARVATRRLTGRMMGLDDKSLPTPIDPTLSPEGQAAAIAQDSLRKQTREMPDERRDFGPANVDVLLQREEEVLKNWALLLEVPELAEKRK